MEPSTVQCFESVMRKLLILSLLLAAAPALARECPLGRATFEPVDEPRRFEIEASRDGHSYRFTLRAKHTGKTIAFIGSFQNGTGFMHLDEDVSDRDGISTRGVVFRKDLKTADPWGAGEKPVAYAFFDRLAVGVWDRLKTEGHDQTHDNAPPDGLWRISRCRAR